MTPRMRRLVDGPVADHVRGLAIEHPDWTAVQIHREVTAKHGEPSVSLRTVQRFLREFKPPDPSERWSIADDDPEDGALVLSVVRMLIEESSSPWPSWPRWPTRAIARWIIRIQRAYPDLDD